MTVAMITQDDISRLERIYGAGKFLIEVCYLIGHAEYDRLYAEGYTTREAILEEVKKKAGAAAPPPCTKFISGKDRAAQSHD